MRATAVARLVPFVVCASCSFGCGSATPNASSPAEPSPTATAASGEASAPEQGTTTSNEAEPAVPRARIVKVSEVEGNPGDRRVKIEFENPTKAPCIFTTYTMVWPGGRKTIEEKPFEVPPGGKRQRSLRMHPNDGDLTTLSSKDSEIELSAGCSGQ